MTEQKRNTIIEKIQKLFALGNNNPSVEESALAIAKAQELMYQYNVDNIDLIKKSRVSDIIEIDFELQTRFNAPHVNLSVFIGNTFNIKPIIIKTETGYHKIQKKIRFIGDKVDIAFASFVYSYVLSLAEAKSHEYFESVRYKKKKWSPTEAKKARTDFMFGFVDAVNVKLEVLRKQREEENIRNHAHESGMSIYNNDLITAIALVKNSRIDQYINENLGKLKDIPDKEILMSNKAYMSGSVEGEKVNINRGIENNSNEPKLLSAW